MNGGGTCFNTPGVLVAKLDPNGGLVYATRMGGGLVDSSYGTGIAVDAAGHAYVTGVALTSDFPTTNGAYRTGACPNVYPFAGDGFVAKLSVDGRSLVYSTLLCGQGDDHPAGIVIDTAGTLTSRGTTGSSDFPLVNPIERTRGGGALGLSGFVSKLSADGSRLLYSTYLGGSESAMINGIALDGEGSVYVTGETNSVDFRPRPASFRNAQESGIVTRDVPTHSSRRSRQVGRRSSTRRISMANSTTRATQSQSTAPAMRTSWAQRCRNSFRSSTRSRRATAGSTTPLSSS
jgi:hypothetical protein